MSGSNDGVDGAAILNHPLSSPYLDPYWDYDEPVDPNFLHAYTSGGTINPIQPGENKKFQLWVVSDDADPNEVGLDYIDMHTYGGEDGLIMSIKAPMPKRE